MKRISAFLAIVLSTSLASAQTLEEALAIAYENNNSLKASREELKAVDENMMQALSRFLPKVQAQKTNTDISQRNTTTAPRDEGGSNIGTVNAEGIASALVIKQNLFNGGADVATLEKAKHNIEQQRAALKRNEQQVLLSVVQAYANVAASQEQLKLAENRVEAAKKLYEFDEEKFKAGEVTKSIVAKTKANLAMAMSNRIQHQGALEAAKAKYLSLVTVAPDGVTMPSINIIVPSTLDDAMKIALDNNPEIVIARKQQKAAEKDVSIAKAALLPSANISQNWQNNKQNSLTTNTLASTTSIDVIVPIFNGGADWSGIRQSKRKAQSYNYNVLNVTQEVVGNTTKAWSDYESKKASMSAMEDQKDFAKLSYESMLEEQKAGLRSSIDVINQQNNYFDADSQLVEARAQNVIYRYALKAAIGEMTAQGLNLKVTTFDPLKNYNKIRWELIGSY